MKIRSKSNGVDGNRFDIINYILKLLKNKKVKLSNGQVRWQKVQMDYLPFAPRIAWFRKEHPDWSIITKAIQFIEGFQSVT